MTGQDRPLLHRVECAGCRWVGYRRRPHSRPCPRCGIAAAKVRPTWLAGFAPHADKRCCYLLHFWPPLGHAAHYLGFSTNLPQRLAQHLAGGYDPTTHKGTGRGARLTAAAVHHGSQLELVRVWYGEQARVLEQRLKQRHKPGSLRSGAKTSLKRLCPLCNPAGWARRYPNQPDPPQPPRPRPQRFVPTWDAEAEWDAAFPHLADR
jgi:hypothetical protein